VKGRKKGKKRRRASFTFNQHSGAGERGKKRLRSGEPACKERKKRRREKGRERTHTVEMKREISA